MGRRKGPRELAAAREFGRIVAERRRQVGLSQEGAAERAGLHRTEVGFIERGERMARLDTIVKLGGALEVEPCRLLAGMAWELGEPEA